MAAALMAKMKIAARDRPRVKLECLRLSAQGMKQYEWELARFAPEERQATMALTTYWEERGIDKGKNELVSLLVQDRFGDIPAETTARLSPLTSEQFNELGRALLRFDTLTDLGGWLSRHASLS